MTKYMDHSSVYLNGVVIIKHRGNFNNSREDHVIILLKEAGKYGNSLLVFYSWPRNLDASQSEELL
jgi:hypothetical protein